MTTLSLRPAPPLPVTLSVAPTVGGIVLTWQSNADTDTYQVWRNDTNALSGATQIADVLSGTTFTDAISPKPAFVGGPYYWVRAVNQYGVVGPWQVGAETNKGAGFKASYAYLNVEADASITYSVDTVQIRVYYTPSGGSPTNTGWVNFTTTPIPFTGSWSTPANAIGTADGVFSAVSLISGDVVGLAYTLADISVIPDTATITGVQFTVVAESTLAANTFVSVSLGDGSEDVAALTANNTVQSKVAGTSTSMYGLGDGGAYTFLELVPAEAVGAPQLANQTANVLLNVFANGFAYDTGSASGSGSVGTITSVGTTTEGIGSSSAITRANHEPGTAWNTWYDIGSSAGVLINPGPTAVFTSATLDIDWANLSVVTGDVKIEAQLVLHNRDDNTDVKTETFTLMHWNGVTNTLLRSNPIVHWDYVWASLGTSLSNKTYDVRWRLRKTRTDGSATLTMYYNRMYIETSIA